MRRKTYNQAILEAVRETEFVQVAKLKILVSEKRSGILNTGTFSVALTRLVNAKKLARSGERFDRGGYVYHLPDKDENARERSE